MKNTLIYSLILALFLVSCSHEKKLQRASNKIYNLTQKFPQLITDDSVSIRYTDTIKAYNTYVDTFLIDSVLLNLKDSLVLKDSTVTVVVSRGPLGFNILGKSNCPDIVIDTTLSTTHPTIIAQCNCKSEVKAATKELRKQKRRLGFLLLIVCGGIMLFFAFKIGDFLRPW